MQILEMKKNIKFFKIYQFAFRIKRPLFENINNMLLTYSVN